MTTSNLVNKALSLFQFALVAAIVYFTYMYSEMLLIAIFAFITVVTLHEWGHLWLARFHDVTVTDFSIGMGKKFTFFTSKRTGIRYHISMLPIGGYVAMLTDKPSGDGEDKKPPEGSIGHVSDVIREKQGINYLNDIHPFKRIQVLIAGVVMNMLTALVMFVCIFMYLGQDNYETYVARVSDGTELMVGDQITSVNNQSVAFYSDAYELLDANKGDVVTLTVNRDGELVTLQHETGIKESGGVDLNFKFDSKYPAVKYFTFKDSLVESYETSKFMITYTLKKFGQLFTGEEEYHKVLNGPVGITNAAGETLNYHKERAQKRAEQEAKRNPGSTEQSDSDVPAVEASTETYIWAFVDFVARISVALAIMNILPIPVVDGGHIVVAMAEWVKGSRVGPTFQKVYGLVGVAALLLLYSLALSSDYINFLS